MLLFTIFQIFNFSFFVRQKYYWFITSFLITLFVHPIFQKFSDSSMVGDTYGDVNFTRVQTNIVLIYILTLLILISKRKFNFGPQAVLLKRFWITYIILGVFNVVFSIEVERSFFIYLISIIGPFLFLEALLLFPNKVFTNVLLITKHILYAVGVFFILGFIFYYYKAFARGIVEDTGSLFIRGGGGIWMSNISTQILVLFFPLVLNQSSQLVKPRIRYTLILFYIILILIALSRTATIVYPLIALIVLGTSRESTFSKILTVFLILVIIYSLILVVYPGLGVDVFELYAGRFFRKGDALETILLDERMRLLKVSLKTFISHPITGVGIGSFIDVNPMGFSNSHNIITNILAERGILVFTLLFFFTIYFYRLNTKCLRVANEISHIDFFKALRYGFTGFLLIGMTGNDLFISSGFVNAWPTYIIVLFLVIQVKYYEFYKS